MQIKICLIGILIGSSYLIGDIIHKSFIKRHSQLNESIRMLEIIRMDLSFGLYTLEEIFYRASLKKNYCLWSFCYEMQKDLSQEDGRTLEDMINKNILNLRKDTNLQNKEIEELKKLFLILGQSDISSQQRLIDLTCENLKKLTGDSKEEILKKGSLYKKLITFIGISIGIILI